MSRFYTCWLQLLRLALSYYYSSNSSYFICKTLIYWKVEVEKESLQKINQPLDYYSFHFLVMLGANSFHDFLLLDCNHLSCYCSSYNSTQCRCVTQTRLLPRYMILPNPYHRLHLDYYCLYSHKQSLHYFE